MSEPMTEADLQAIKARSKWAMSNSLEAHAHWASAADVPALLARVADLEAERDLMRPVVEAAEAWRSTWRDQDTGGVSPLELPLLAAVDAWRAARPVSDELNQPLTGDGDEKAPTDGPAATRGEAITEEQLADEIARTKAQRGVRGVDFGPHPHGLGEILSVEPTSDAMRSAPADPAGLDEAIEAAAIALAESYVPIAGHTKTWNEFQADRAVRAAAPHIRRAVLLEAAGELNRFAVGEEVGVLRWLRERAERETT